MQGLGDVTDGRYRPHPCPGSRRCGRGKPPGPRSARERRRSEALVQHLLDVAADILGMNQALREGVAVERKHVFGDVTARFLVRVAEFAEEFLAALADFFLEPLGEIGPHMRIDVFIE